MTWDDNAADLADIVSDVARLLRARAPRSTGIVPMTETERLVMRFLDLAPGSSPTEIASRLELQKTNVSTALRSLEAKGFIQRDRHGRTASVNPTAVAAANLKAIRHAWSAELRGARLSGLSASDMTTTINALRVIEEALLSPIADLR